MSNENLEIKYFQIGDCPVIFTGKDIEDVKAYVVENNWPKEFLKDIENGKCDKSTRDTYGGVCSGIEAASRYMRL